MNLCKDQAEKCRRIEGAIAAIFFLVFMFAIACNLLECVDKTAAIQGRICRTR